MAYEMMMAAKNKSARVDSLLGCGGNFVHFVCTKTIYWKTRCCHHDKPRNVCIYSWLARKWAIKNKLFPIVRSRYVLSQKRLSFRMLCKLPQQEDSLLEASVQSNQREQLEYETLQSLDWFLICERVAAFCRTEKVKRFVVSGMMVNDWSKEQTQQYLKETDECIHLMQSGSTESWLEGAQLLDDIVSKAQKGLVLTPKELYQIACTTAAVSKWKKSTNEPSVYPSLYKIVEDVVSMKPLEDMIYKCIDEKEQVKDEASARLMETRTQIRSTFESIKKALQGLLRKYAEYLQEPIYTERFGRFVIPVKANYRNKVAGIIQDISSSGLTLYIEPTSISNLTKRLQQLVHIEEEEVEEILSSLSNKVSENADHLLHISRVVFQLDWILARAQFSREINGRMPIIVDSIDSASSYGADGWKLSGVRHPLLLLQETNGENSVVPIDFKIRRGVTAVCITGPNTGGKTVALKTFGVVVLMTKVGLFVPCAQEDDICIPFFERVFADIGDHQSVIQSVSTFSSHILRIQRILQLSNRQSLVLLDEVGTGTDPTQGCALAMSLLLYLVERVGFLMVTTHHGELKTLKYKDSRFENASVEFDTVRLKPNYRLVWGVAGRSNAIDIAQRLGLDSRIVENARNMIETTGDKLSLVIEDVERMREQVIYWKEEVERKERTLQLLEKQLLEREARMEQLEQEWMQTKRQELEQEYANAREEIAKVIKQVQQYGTDASYIMEKKQELESIKVLRKNGSRQDYSMSPSKVHKGDWVIVKSLSSEPLQVVEEMNSKGEFMVRLGSIRVKVSRTEAVLTDNNHKHGSTSAPSPSTGSKKRKAKQSEAQVSVPTTSFLSSSSVRTKRNTIDVRGCRVDEATAKIENELGRDAECGQYFVIHGFGTLRTGLRHYFQRHPLIRQIKDADIENGGQGVSILHLQMD